jgi:hypothetical protein
MLFLLWLLSLFVKVKPARRYGLWIRRDGLQEWMVVTDGVREWVIVLTEVRGLPGDEWRRN